MPKPIYFGILGALGCSIGWLFGEPLLLVIQDKNDEGDSEASPAVLIFNQEFNRRLEREGAKTGDVQLSLMWNNINDLDIHCVDPGGEEIFFKNKRSRSKGTLDVDMNVRAPRSVEPVENIFWPPGKAPSGTYRVYVHHYQAHGGTDPTPYTVGVKVAEQQNELTGTISHGDPIRLVHQFTFQPNSNLSGRAVLFPSMIIGFWTALLAVGLSLALIMGQNLQLRRTFLTLRQATILSGGSITAGLLSGSLSQFLFGYISQVELLVTAGRMFGWMLLGFLLGFAMSFFIPNLPRKKAALAGAIGGFLGAAGFLLGANLMGDFAGRWVGAGVLGFSIGMMVAIAERLAREASLIVHWGPNEQSIVSLGAQPVILGSSPEAHVYLQKHKGFPPISALVTFRNGQIEMDNKMTNSKHILRNGNKLKMGGLTVEVQTAE